MPYHASARRFRPGAAASPLCARSASPPVSHPEQRLRQSFPSTKDRAAPSGSLSEGAAWLYCGMIVGRAGLVGRLALTLVDLFEVGVHNLLVAALAASRTASLRTAILRAVRTTSAGAAPRTAGFTGLSLVELLADL